MGVSDPHTIQMLMLGFDGLGAGPALRKVQCHTPSYPSTEEAKYEEEEEEEEEEN